MKIYLDHAATTPMDPQVFEAMKPYFMEKFGNASSSTHAWGWEAEEVVTMAREIVAHGIGAQPHEIIWTSGASESINTALKGVVASSSIKSPHIISCVTEHSSSLGPLKYLESQGVRVTYLPVNSRGDINLEELKNVITPDTLLISLLAAHNETGSLHPLAEIGKIAKERGVFFHVDAAQACGKMALDVESLGIDLLSASAHKFYGPKGVGFLYVRKRHPHVNLVPLIHGNSDSYLRAGTLPVTLIVGLAKALEIALRDMSRETKHLLSLRQHLYEGLNKSLDIVLNSPSVNFLPGIVNMSFKGVRAVDIIAKMRHVALSTGSACTSGSHKPSYVLKAMGMSDEQALSSLRFGIGRYNTEEEIDAVVSQLVKVVKSFHE